MWVIYCVGRNVTHVKATIVRRPQDDNTDILTGGLLAYVGFGRLDLGAARSVVAAFGVVYLLVGILGFILPNLFGLIPSGYTVFDNLLHLVLGVLSLVFVFTQPDTAAARR